jgi:hypothetical protein
VRDAYKTLYGIPEERRSRTNGLDYRGFKSRQGLGIFLFTTAFRSALGPNQPPIQWVPGALSLWVKRPGREADYSSPSNADVKECVELYLHTPNTPSWRGAQLKKRRNNLNRGDHLGCVGIDGRIILK